MSLKDMIERSKRERATLEVTPQDAPQDATKPSPAANKPSSLAALIANKPVANEPPAAKAVMQAAQLPAQSTPASPKMPDVPLTGAKAETFKLAPTVEELANTQVDLADDFVNPGQPESYTQEEAQEFIALFDMLKNNITDAAVVGQMTHSVIAKLRANRTLRKVMQPEHMGLMVRGLRESYGVSQEKKTERKEKASAAQDDADQLAAFLKEL